MGPKKYELLFNVLKITFCSQKRLLNFFCKDDIPKCLLLYRSLYLLLNLGLVDVHHDHEGDQVEEHRGQQAILIML